jgi:type IV pilus assembly protein PilM
MSLFAKNLDVFGLDLSDRSIKVAQLKKAENGMNLYSYARTDVPKGLIVDGEIKNEEEVIRLIKKTLQDGQPKQIRSKFVVYSIPETKGFIRVIRIPKIEGDNLDETIKFEAEQLFPLNIADSYTDWQILPSSTDRMLDVLVAAVPIQLVDSYSSMLKNAGLTPVAAEIESIAISRSLINEKQSSRPILIVDLGKDRTSFIIYKNPAVQFTASIPVCGNEFNKAISEAMNLDDNEAEKLKRVCGLSMKRNKVELAKPIKIKVNADNVDENRSDSHISDVLISAKKGSEASKTNDGIKAESDCNGIYKAIHPLLHEMTKYISKLSDYYKEHYKEDSDIAKVIICGGEARMLGISSYLSLKIKKEVEKGNPWVNIIPASEKEIPPISRDDSLIFATVLGLAIRGINEL